MMFEVFLKLQPTVENDGLLPLLIIVLVYLIEKNEEKDILKHEYNIEIQFQTKIYVLYFDNGIEYFNKVFW